jgi:dihydroneopterin aldolase/2-amino-4-hydroxy-6-hydroxymethyldihydropteridine diphosphokinase
MELSDAGTSDDINKTVNYAEICAGITEFTKENTCNLIESAVEQLAEYLLINYPLLKEVELTLRKPWAPIGLPVDCAGVSIRRGRHRAYIALGSNMGNEKQYLDEAIKKLDEDPSCRVVRVSDYIVTKPYGGVEQDDFLNGALELETLYSPLQLLKRLNEIEAEEGRKRLVHWGPRTLDLDMILYDDAVIQTEKLTVPHIDMCNRDFVLKPMAQIAPYTRHPVNGKTMTELLGNLLDKEKNNV